MCDGCQAFRGTFLHFLGYSQYTILYWVEVVSSLQTSGSMNLRMSLNELVIGSVSLTPSPTSISNVNTFGSEQDPKKLLLNESENLEVFEQFYIMTSIERRILGS